ncbi:MAG: hypothetical protein P8K08_21555 [Fuerstiella sp.]|nr:hypothetical protein [Fuerstiella sp.]
MIRSILILAAVLIAVTPVNAAKRRTRHMVYRPVTRTVPNVTTRTVTTKANTTNTSARTTTTKSADATTSAVTTAASAKSASTSSDPEQIKESPLQMWAEAEAKMMVERRYKGHVRSAPMGTFVGVGFSMSGRVVTCVGSGQLVAQATLRGPDGFYHVRVWR